MHAMADTKKRRGYLRIFASYYKPHWKLFALDMVCALCICLVDLAFPVASRYAMQTLLPQQAFRAFFAVMAVLAGAYVLKGFFYFIITYWGHLLHLLGPPAGGADGGRHPPGPVFPHAGSVLFLL